MCTGLEIPAIISAATALAGAGVSAYGAHQQSQEAQANAEARAEARNAELRRTMAKNKKIANESRAVADARIGGVQPEAMDATQQRATQDRTETIEQQVETPDAGSVPLRGSAPAVVKSEAAKKLADAFGEGKERAKALGKLGGYGDTWLMQGFENAQAGRDIGLKQDFAAGNLGILPFAQDAAEMAAYEPVSPLGGILQGVGSAMGSYAGAGMPGLNGLSSAPAVVSPAAHVRAMNPRVFGGLM